jgi:biotin transport system substrate-specific component
MSAATIPAVITTPLLHRSRVTSAGLVAGFALLTAAAAQIEIPLWFTPVPITGQTFAVLLSGAALGWRAGAASQGLYLVLGAVGLPFFRGGEGGWEIVSGATGGYLIGFIAAAALVGYLAERRGDRAVRTAVPVFLLGSVVIYAFGVPWLAASLGVSVAEALRLGLVPFIAGDLIKIGLAGLALPAAWRLIDRTA